MKKLSLILIILTATISVFAVNQKGTVRSIARPNKASAALPNAIIRVRGSHNAVESGQNGEYSLLLQNKQNGDPIVFSTVTLSGWEVAEQSFIGRQIACSDQVPVEIIMVNQAELQREKETIATKARQNVEVYYEKRLAHLDSLLADGKLIQADYQKKLDDLELKYEQFEPLLQTMAEQYARTDIAQLDSLSRQINAAIEAGNPDEAERLIKLKGDIDQREKQLREEQEQINQAQAMVAQAAENNRKKMRELGKDFQHLYAICLNRMQLDSAAYYLIRRAQTDTLDVDWQMQAGRIAREVRQDMASAGVFLNRAVNVALQQYGRESRQYATAINELGVYYRENNNLTKAQQLYEESLQIRKQIFGEKSLPVAESLNNLGGLARSNKDYNNALKYNKEALEIRANLLGEKHIETAESLNNIGGIYYTQGKCKQAIEYFLKASEIFDSQPKAAMRQKATALNNIGGAYYCLGDKEKAVESFERAYQLYKTVLGEDHPMTKNTLHNINYCKQ